MNHVLTPFQLWCMFRMYTNPNGKFSARQLLLECCESSLKTLSEGDVDQQLSDLCSTGYVSEKMLGSGEFIFWISNNGILYVRKNLAAISTACAQNQLPESAIDVQDDDVARALRNNDPDLKSTIVDAGIRNIGNIPMLIEQALRFMN